MKYSSLINLKDGTTTNQAVSIIERVSDNGAVAVFVNALSKDFYPIPIDAELGVKVNIEYTDLVKSYMSICRYNEWWCEPRFGNTTASIPDETQALIIENSDKTFFAAVPVVNDTYKCVFAGNDEKSFSAKLFSWCDDLYVCDGLAFVYANGDNPIELVNKCVKTALSLLNNGTRLREERRYPEIFEYLGWCSWDSMHIGVCEEGLLQKCSEFKEKEIPVRWAIIDDMWAEIRDFYGREYTDVIDMIYLMHSSALYHFKADPLRFPNGLAECISKMKEFGIKVGMWIPTTGYWRGIDPNGKAYNELKDYLFKNDKGYYLPDWHTEKSYMYFKVFHDYFRKCGAEFIKTDNQSMIMSYYKKLAPVGKVAKGYHDGLEASVGEHFDNAMINCMGTASEDVWSRSVSPITRCSGDFKPENRKWFTHHICQCAYSSILLGQFYWCDWDMWWTDDAQARKNSLMRAISGGPIYVSDKICRSKREVLMPLCFDTGEILRCDRPAYPTKDCVTTDPTMSGLALKIQNAVGEYGIMVAVNIDKNGREVEATIGGENIDGFFADEYVVFEHYSKEIKILRWGETFDITLKDNDDYRLFIFSPLKEGFAAIGRTDKFISPKTIKFIHNKEVILKENGPYAYVENKVLIERTL